MITMQDMERLLFTGGDVVGEDGRKIGSVGQLFLDASTGDPAWVTVTTGLFGTSESFVPLVGAHVRDDDVVVPYSKDLVKHAPRIDSAEGSLSPEEEHDLYRHYGLVHDEPDAARDDRPDDGVDDGLDVPPPAARTVPEPVSDTVPEPVTEPVTEPVPEPVTEPVAAVAPSDTPARPADDSMVLSAEQLRVVGTERVPTERVRLRRYTVTEQREITVPVRREEVRVEYEPADEGVPPDADGRPDAPSDRGPDDAGDVRREHDRRPGAGAAGQAAHGRHAAGPADA